MTPIADMVRRMAAQGLTIEAIAIAVEAVEIQHEEKQAHRREQERIRQRNHRDRTRDTRDTRDTVNALSFKKEEVIVKEEELKEKKVRKSVGFVCPSDFKPDDGDYKVGDDYGICHSMVDSKCASMIEWSQANRNRAVARKSDWHLTLRGFIRREGKPRPVDQGLTPEEYHRQIHGGKNGKAENPETSDRCRIEGTSIEGKLFQTR